MSETGCGFCDRESMRSADIYIENDDCIFFAFWDPEMRAAADLPPDVLPGSGAIVPIVHRNGPFELSDAEWAATQDLLIKARSALHERLAPDGYTIGWNSQGGRLHAHLHVIPRFHDEPMWNQGVRSAIKVPENVRPEPWAPGDGDALHGDRV